MFPLSKSTWSASEVEQWVKNVATGFYCLPKHTSKLIAGKFKRFRGPEFEKLSVEQLQRILEKEIPKDVAFSMALTLYDAFRKDIALLTRKLPKTIPYTCASVPIAGCNQIRMFRFKIVFVGTRGAGKTSYIHMYDEGTYCKNYSATIGVDFSEKDVVWDNRTVITVQMWDVGGQERFMGTMTSTFYRHAQAAFVVYDIQDPKSLEGAKKWKKDIDDKVTLPNGKPIPVVLLANKCDRSENTVDLDEVCREHGFLKWFLTSAKTNVGIQESMNYLLSQVIKNEEIQAKEDRMLDENIIRLSHSYKRRSKCTIL